MSTDSFILHPKAETALTRIGADTQHAVLLTGPRGSGKAHHARTLALKLLGGIKDTENVSGIRVIAPLKASITIEQIRELLRFFRLKASSTSSIQRVAIIEDADLMGLEAQNALLKLLEEPPLGSVLLLTSSDPHTLLPTIQSRVQQVYLQAPERDALEKHFLAAGHSKESIRGALMRAGTNVAEATRLLSSNEPDPAMLAVKQALGGTAFDRLLMVDAMSKQKEAAIVFIDTLAIVAAASLESAAHKSTQVIVRWQAVLKCAITAQEALSQNGNTKLVLTELMLSM